MGLARPLALAAAAVLLLGGGAEAAVWRVPGHFPTIQAAIDSSLVADGDTVLVQAGVRMGATVKKAIVLRGHGRATISDGPVVNALGKAGFLFAGGGAGSGATITGFVFDRVAFPVFSRGADDVSVTHNSMWRPIQAVTSWANASWGKGWDISHNDILGLRTSCGGGIGILIGDYAGGTVTGNLIAHNRIRSRLRVPPTDCGGYNAPGIVLFADFRYPGDQGAAIQGNRVVKNRVAVTSGNPGLVTASAIELSDTRDLSTELVIQKNDVVYNDLRGSSEPFEITPGELEAVNRIEHNYTGPSTAWPGLTRNGVAGEAPPPGAAAAPIR